MLLLYMNFMGAVYVMSTIIYSIVSRKKKYLRVLVGSYILILLTIFGVGIVTHTARRSVLLTQFCCMVSLVPVVHKNKDL